MATGGTSFLFSRSDGDMTLSLKIWPLVSAPTAFSMIFKDLILYVKTLLEISRGVSVPSVNPD